LADLESEDAALPRAVREGLPKGYRMRADAHYVDQLSARSADVPMRLVSIDDIDDPGSGSTGDAAQLQPLIRSIGEHGVLQPLLVGRDAARYRLISGSRRLAAARAAALTRVPCLVHHLEDAQVDAVARACNIRGAAAADVPSAAAVSRSESDVVAHVSEAIATIQSAAALLAGQGSSPMARRLALDLVRAEAWRASWQLRAAAILGGTHRWQFKPAPLASVLARVRDGFAPESRLRGIDLTLNVADWNTSSDLDEDALVAAVCGAVVATAGLIGDVEAPQLTLTARRNDGKGAVIEIAQDTIAAGALADRFFDLAWPDRPGGRAAGIGAAVASAVAGRHAGDAAFVSGAGRGTTVRLTLARSPLGSRH
jgi:ParB-like nuclease family protein